MQNRAWLFVLPVLILVAVNALIPIMAVINYSFHISFAGSAPEFAGLGNYIEVLTDPDFLGALKRQFVFSFAVLLVQIPLGILVALSMPKQNKWAVGIVLVLMGIPLLIPHIVVGLLWRIMAAYRVGLLSKIFTVVFGYEYLITKNPIDAVATIFGLDCWHWTSLVALLCYAGLRAIPEQYYQAAEIDGAGSWKTFWYVTLPKLRSVLIIAVLLRFMDSFMIYAEPFLITGGGPGNWNTYLNIFVARKAESYELGFAGASSMIYLYIVVVCCYIFYTMMTRAGKGGSK
jgi:glycerol transport system permease protein